MSLMQQMHSALFCKKIIKKLTKTNVQKCKNQILTVKFCLQECPQWKDSMEKLLGKNAKTNEVPQGDEKQNFYCPEEFILQIVQLYKKIKI